MNCTQQWTLCFILLFPTYLYADIYTWQDERGITHFTNLPYSVHPDAQVVTFGVMNYMRAVDVDAVDWKSVDRSNNTPVNKPKPNASFLNNAKQCNEWRIELASLRDTLKKGYTLKKAKALQNKKRELRDAIWRECR